MLHVRFDRDRALAVVGHLARGEAIPPPPSGWTPAEALALAGLMFSVAASHEPPSVRDRAMNIEQREAHHAQFAHDLLAAIPWLGELMRLAVRGEYDARFEPVVIFEVDTAAGTITALEGVHTPQG